MKLVENSIEKAMPGEMFTIDGERLHIGGSQSDRVRLYLSDQDGVETKVEKLLKNEPVYISGRLPDTLVTGLPYR